MLLSARLSARSGICHMLRQQRLALPAAPAAKQRPARTLCSRSTSSSKEAETSNAAVAPPPDIKALAKMAQIAVTDQEVAEWGPKIGGIVEWFGALQAVDVSGVEPAIHARQEGVVLRQDEPRVYDHRPEIMSQVPDLAGAFVKVPKITTAADDVATPQQPQASSSAAELSAEDVAAVQALDLRVGRILSCEQHPDADSLYVESIDVGEVEPRTIVSGLVKYVPLEEMQGRAVVVLANLKPRNMRGIKSFGMLLAASDAAHENVEPLTPPEGAVPGERVWFGSTAEQAAPMAPNQLEKKKVWDVVKPGLSTSTDCIAQFRGHAMMTSAGPIKSVTLQEARIG